MRALKLCHLKSTVSALPGGLDHEVEDGGANFSLGQRQLLAMTRALLRQSRIVILDEASAALDLHSDVQMRQVVKEQFCDRGATVLVIAHRLHTILDASRIAVFDAGRLVEFDTPQRLLSDKSGYLRGLLDETNASGRIHAEGAASTATDSPDHATH